MKNILIYSLLTYFIANVPANSQMIDLFNDDSPQENTVNASEEEEKAEPTPAERAAAPQPEIQQQKENTAEKNTDYLDAYIDDVETEKKAQNTARALLNKKPTILTLRQNEIKSLKKLKEKTDKIQTKKTPEAVEKNENQAETQTEQNPEIIAQKIKAKLQPAPFGLYWAATADETKKLGFELNPAERKDYKNVLIVKNPQQKNDTFQQITAIFGEQNKLWCIYAQGRLLEDDAQASKALALYHRYYQALSAKYGNAQEHFEPYTYEEELIEGDGNQKKISKITKQNPIGGDNFIQELQEGKAVLYATFQNDEIGVTLGISVDGNGKSYISIDYKNFALRESEQQTVLNKTIEDL